MEIQRIRASQSAKPNVSGPYFIGGLNTPPTKPRNLQQALIGLVREKGGFRKGSPNFVGEEAITDARDAFLCEGYVLSAEGELHPSTLDNLSGISMTATLEAYVRRAQRGSEDGALLGGTGKDLLEATAEHVITEKYGQYPQQANFPTLLGQALAPCSIPMGSFVKRVIKSFITRYQRMRLKSMAMPFFFDS